MIDLRQFNNRFVAVAASATGVTLLVQILAFLRQLLIAAYFGVGRDFAAYVMVNMVATIVVFTFAGIFDSVAVPHLVRARNNDSPERALALARSIFRLSVWLGGVMSLAFLIAVPLLAPLFAAGFAPEERGGLAKLAWYFLPWTLVALPFYAAGARYKMDWRFNRVFAAEITIVVVSIGVLALHHSDITMLPLAYAAGYGTGLAQLAAGSGLWRRLGGMAPPSVRGVLRNIGELFLANQTAGGVALADRHVQSFLPSAGIGALSYSSQIVSSVANLLNFREIYMVPLTQQGDRAERLERLFSGLVLMAVPLAGLVSCFAPDFVQVLLQRGRFDAAATALTAEALQIGALGLVTSSLLAPLARMFQIVDRIHYIHVSYVSWAIAVVVFGYLFVVILGWGVRGAALMQLGGSAVTVVVSACLLSRCGVVLRWRAPLGWFVLAALVSGTAYLVAATAAATLTNPWLRLVVGGATYGLVVLACYFLARAQLRGVIFGVSSYADSATSAGAIIRPADPDVKSFVADAGHSGK